MNEGYLSEDDQKKYREYVNSLYLPVIVRCKDCKYNPSNGTMAELLPYYFPCKSIPREDNYFCADGERKDGR